MPSTDREARPRRRQRGVSLIESVVASALLGIGVVAGLTAWDTAIISAQKGVREAWARCMVRSELDAILAAPWSDPATSYPAADPNLTVIVADRRGAPGTQQEEVVVTVQARDLQSHAVIFQASALKLRALAGAGQKAMTAGVLSDVVHGCPPP